MVQAIPYPESKLDNTTAFSQRPLQEVTLTTEEVRYLNRLDDSEGVDSSTPLDLEDEKISSETLESLNTVSEKIYNRNLSSQTELKDKKTLTTLKPSLKDSEGRNKSNINPAKKDERWSGWIYKALTDGMMHFMIQSQEQKCSRDGEIYRQELKNLSLWATRSK